ncbi:MAG: hypothetical protein OQK55_03550, partial [Thermoanaerobaculales bacterium]|nr:hypothetical protein [Thermoanaerobaculales bacterium]
HSHQGPVVPPDRTVVSGRDSGRDRGGGREQRQRPETASATVVSDCAGTTRCGGIQSVLGLSSRHVMART